MRITAVIDRLTAIRDQHGEVDVEWRSEHHLIPTPGVQEPSDPVTAVDFDDVAGVAVIA